MVLGETPLSSEITGQHEPTMFENYGVELPPELRQLLPDWLKNSPNAETRVVTTNWPGITIVSSPMAEKLTSDELWQITQENFNKPESEGGFIIPEGITGEAAYKAAHSIIESSGVLVRHRSPRLSETRTYDDVIADASLIGALLLDLAIENHGKKPNHVFVTNLNLPHLLTQMVVAKSLNLDPDTSFESVRAACGAQLVALIKAKLDPNLKDKTIAIVSVEPSGHLQEDMHFRSLEHLAIPATFTDLTTVSIIDLDQFDLLDHAIHVVPGGGIEVDISYKEELENRGPLPEYLTKITYADGEDGTTGKSIVVINQHGVFVNINAPENGMHATMDGGITTKHFRLHTPKFAEKLKNYSLDFFTYHNPSKSVIHHIKTMYKKMGLMGTLDELKFILDKIGIGNATSATNFAHLQYILHTYLDKFKKPKQNETIGALSMAIGSLFARAVLRRKSKQS